MLSPTEKSLTFDPIFLIIPEASPPIPEGNQEDINLNDDRYL